MWCLGVMFAEFANASAGICVQIAVFKNLDRSYERDYEKGLLKNDPWKFLRTKQSSLRHKTESSDEVSDDNLFISNNDMSAIDFGDTRRTKILEWIKHLLFKAPDNQFNKNFQDVARVKQEEANMTSILVKLTDVLYGLNENLKQTNQNTFLTLRVPVDRRRRFRRSIDNETPTVTEKIDTKENNDSAKDSIKLIDEKPNERTTNNKIITDENKNAAIDKISTNDETSVKETATQNNDTKEDDAALLEELPIYLPVNNESTSVELELEGRRAVPTTKSRVKEKLLAYLEDMFNDIEKKLQPLTKVKISISSDSSYRIGYVIANIDTLEIKLRRLKAEMRANRRFWNDAKVMELFDRLKVTNNVVSSLLETLTSYLPISFV